jgi:hypothetical protein
MLLGVKKAKIGPQSPKTEFGHKKQYGRVISTYREFYEEHEKICIWGSKRRK